MMKKNEHLLRTSVLVFVALLLLAGKSAYNFEPKNFRDEGQFQILVGGKEIGQEKFAIQASGDSIRSNSTLNFRDPQNSRQNVSLETELAMDSNFVPKTYQLKTDLNGRKGIVRGTFENGQATFEYVAAGGSPRKTGLLVGERYVVLDTNVFHHFIFIARQFEFGSSEKAQSMEVVIPQELRNGLLRVSDAGMEKVSIRGKSRELHHLKADSGSVQIDLWLDDHQLLQKIAIPSKRIEVIRS